MSNSPWTPNYYDNKIDDAVLNGPNQYYNFSDKELEILYFNNIKNNNPPRDHDINALRNSQNYKSKEFTRGIEFIFAGCSYTDGYGLDDEHIWGFQVAQKLGMSYNNLSIYAGSTNLIVHNIFGYFKKYGHPKVLMCLFPNFERVFLPINSSILLGEHKIKKGDLYGDSYLSPAYLEEIPTRKKYSSAPHDMKDVIPLDISYWMSIQSINILEQYCELAGIDLYWSTWEFNHIQSFKKMKKINNEYFKYMIDVELEKWQAFNLKDYKKDHYHPEGKKQNDICLTNSIDVAKCTNIIECHLDEKTKNPEIFEWARDSSHFGYHRHIHIADAFLKSYEVRHG